MMADRNWLLINTRLFNSYYNDFKTFFWNFPISFCIEFFFLTSQAMLCWQELNKKLEKSIKNIKSIVNFVSKCKKH